MNLAEWVLTVVAGLGIPTLVIGLVHARSINSKLVAEASHLDTEDVRIISTSAMQLLAPLRERLSEVEKECADLRKQVGHLSAEVEHQRQIINTTTVKLEAANRAASFYKQAFDDRAGT